MKMQPEETILFIGDSITDCERRDPAFSPFGRGYVQMFRNLLLQRHTSWRVRIVNRGVNGDTIRDLERRWEEDVLAERPDRLVIAIGINDVWRSFSTPEQQDLHVPLDEYRAVYAELLRVSQESGIQGTWPHRILSNPTGRNPCGGCATGTARRSGISRRNCSSTWLIFSPRSTA